jgi:glyoxylase-like metal-dependent hydrolase (beta-lactamase superfamily II)
MSTDILALADRLWRGEADIGEFHPVGHRGGLAEICDGVAFVPAFANVTAIATADGIVLVDTGSAFAARSIHDDLRRWTRQRLHTAVYSHGHIDHVFGVPVWAAEAVDEGWPAPVVVAHEGVPARFDRYRLTTGYNEIINQRQFGIAGLRWPADYRYPDRTYSGQLTLEVGGVRLELRHERGETDDHTVTWLPERRVLCCGDLFIWASPNAGNPQKVQRYPLEWAQALRRMAELRSEVLLPGHGLPVIGADRVAAALTDTAVLLESLVEQTLAVMNGGGRLDDAIHSATLPRQLADRPYLQPVYDEPEFIVRTVWRRYGGWWDGNPATLKPAPERALAAELAALAGGPGVLAARAVELAERELAAAGGAEDVPAPAGSAERERAVRPAGEVSVAALPGGEEGLRVAGHLAELAWLAAPEDNQIAKARHRVFSIRAERATSTMSAGIYRWAAGESLGDPFGQRHESGGPDDD